jgi:hypothetical protein
VKEDILLLPLSQGTIARHYFGGGTIENELLWELENKEQ